MLKEEEELPSPETKRFTTKELEESFALAEELLVNFEAQNSNVARYNKVERGISDALRCNKEMYEEKKIKSGKNGMGAYHGKASYDSFTHRKSCLIRNYNKIADAIGKKRYPPYSESKIKFLSKMLREQSIPGLKYVPYLFMFGLGVASVLIIKEIAKAAGTEDD
ncbi:aldehyde dehydrogenase 3, member A2 [Halocaridina rubra]|uniref:Aldehyde dehydrogenase 3, member A2 n=1 Tax=Halocaridina rubra TaxID=373956 RepID=A0AAN8ZYJ6_HALRR